MIEELIKTEKELESPPEQDIYKTLPPEFRGFKAENVTVQKMIDLTVRTVIAIVKGAKRMPGFNTLLKKDMETLMKV